MYNGSLIISKCTPVQEDQANTARDWIVKRHEVLVTMRSCPKKLAPQIGFEHETRGIKDNAFDILNRVVRNMTEFFHCCWCHLKQAERKQGATATPRT
jgi:hypothetical protein